MQLRQLSSRLIARDYLPLRSVTLRWIEVQRFILGATVTLFVLGFLSLTSAEAGFASRFSLSLQEEYNDNIFFQKDKEADFITFISPTLSLFYAFPGQTVPVFQANLTTSGQIFARHSEASNFGDNIRFNTTYTHFYSPRLTFYVSDAVSLVGNSRTGEFGLGTGTIRPPTTLPPTGELPTGGRTDNPVSSGRQIQNNFSLNGAYTYNPNISFVADYGFRYANFLDRGGSEWSQRVNGRGVYKWRDEHNIHFGYGIEIIKTRDGESNVIHNFDIGDDYFSSYKIQLDPTLTIVASSGLSINAGSGGPRVANNTNVTLTKLWEKASVNVGGRKGLTPSLGVSGISDTTSFFANSNIRLTEFLSASAGVDYSLFDTNKVNFSSFQATASAAYRIASWLSSSLQYAHRWVNTPSASGANSTDLLTKGKINSNSVSLVFTATLDVWPNFGLSRGAGLP